MKIKIPQEKIYEDLKNGKEYWVVTEYLDKELVAISPVDKDGKIIIGLNFITNINDPEREIIGEFLDWRKHE